MVMGPTAGFHGAIFDVDGVLVDSPHERAWREAFQQLMDAEWRDVRDRSTYTPERFTSEVYQQVMSGKPRMSGARAVLDYFEVPDAESRVAAYADRKQKMITRAHRGRRVPRPTRTRCGSSWPSRTSGILVSAASSSKNAGLFLERIRLDVFAAEHGLAYPTVKAGPDPARPVRRQPLRAGLRARQARPDDVPRRGAGAGPAAGGVLRDRGRRLRHPGRQGRRHGRARRGPGRRRGRRSAEAGADLVVTSLDDVAVDALSNGTLALGEHPVTTGRDEHPPREPPKALESIEQVRRALERGGAQPCSSTTTAR